MSLEHDKKTDMWIEGGQFGASEKELLVAILTELNGCRKYLGTILDLGIAACGELPGVKAK